MPEMPAGFGINQSNPLQNTMPSYAEQVLVCTGHNRWPSDIADENRGNNLVAELRSLVGRGGSLSNPYYKSLLTNASFSSTGSTSVYLLPSFKYLPEVDRSSTEALVRGYLLPDAGSPIAEYTRENLLKKPELQAQLPAQDVDHVLVLICGHGDRDVRCGILGPLLEAEFERMLEQKQVQLVKNPATVHSQLAARVGQISHISGHKFAGNVIVYIPPTLKIGGAPHPLAGAGVWYGRVEPKHVEGIVQETILGGKIIGELWRGGLRQGGELLDVR